MGALDRVGSAVIDSDGETRAHQIMASTTKRIGNHFEMLWRFNDSWPHFVDIQRRGGFDLRGIISIDVALQLRFGGAEAKQTVDLEPECIVQKILSMTWETGRDTFSFQTSFGRVHVCLDEAFSTRSACWRISCWNRKSCYRSCGARTSMGQYQTALTHAIS